MAGYSARQSTFTTGDTITAAHSNNEFNAILAAFHVSTGHKHDGSTAGDGGPISTLFSNAISMGTGADTDIALTFNANTNDGVITWMEDQDYFQFSDDILISTTEKLQFRDTAIYINSSADGQLDLVADTEIQIAATTIDINGNVQISGSLALGDTAITSTAAELNILDGVTSTTAELNILDGVTSTTAELNILDGVTSTAAELNILDGVTSTTAELNLVDGITPGTVSASKAIIVDSDKDLTGIRNLTIAGDLTISGDDLTMATNTAGNLLIADGTNYNPTAIGDLSEISSVANDDVLLALDTSGGGLKKVTRSTLVAGLTAGTEISNLVEDTTPQLGGDLDAQGKDITDVGILSADASAGIYGATGSPVVFTVTVASKTSGHPYNGDGSSSAYFLNGVESPAIQLHGADSVTSSTGYYYKFDQAEGTNNGHPLRFYLDAAKSIAYTTGVTTNGTPGTAGAYTTIAVTDQTPSTLYYQCSSHSYMGNYAVVASSANITSSGAVSIDAVGDVILDADGGDILFKDAGTTFGSATNTSGDLIIKSGTTTALTFSGANATVAGNLIVTGNHTVNGTTTTVNSTTVTIDDPIFTLGGEGTPGSDDNKDRGIEFKYHTGSAAKVGFFGWDDSEGAFTFVPDATNSSEVFSGTAGNVIFGNIAGTLTTAAQTNITSVGALDAGSITSNFGAINVGSSAITTSGAVTGGTLAGTLSTAAQTNITSTGALDGGSITSGFGAIDNGTSGIRTSTFTAETSVVPDASGGADLGSTSLEWGDLYIADDKKIYLGSDQNFSIEYDEDGNDTTAVVAAGGVSLAPHGTGTGNGTELRFQELAANGANYVGFKSPDAIASNEVWVLPNADGTSGQFLKTDGSNALSWGSAETSITTTAVGSITAGRPIALSGTSGHVAEVGLSSIAADTTEFPTFSDEVDVHYLGYINSWHGMSYDADLGSHFVVYKQNSADSLQSMQLTMDANGAITVQHSTSNVASSGIWRASQNDAPANSQLAVFHVADEMIRYEPNRNVHLVIVCDFNSGTSAYQLIARTVKGNAAANSVTFYDLETIEASVQYSSIAFHYDDSADAFLMVGRNEGNSNYGDSYVISVDGDNNITKSSRTTFKSAAMSNGLMATTCDTNVGRSVVTYDISDSGWAKYYKVATVTSTEGLGSLVTGNADVDGSDEAAQLVAVAFYTTANAYVMAFADDSDSRKGKLVVGTLNANGTVTWGTPTVFRNASISGTPGCVEINGRIVIMYQNQSDLKHYLVGTTYLGTDGANYATAVEIPHTNTSGTSTTSASANITADTTANYVIIQQSGVTNISGSNGHRTFLRPAYIPSGTGTIVMGGTATKIGDQQATTSHRGIHDPDTDRTIIGYMSYDGTNYQGHVRVVQPSGTTSSPTLTIGSEVDVSGDDAPWNLSEPLLGYDPVNNKVFAAAMVGTDASDYLLKGYIGTVTGGTTNSISFAGAATIHDPSTRPDQASLSYDVSQAKFVLFYTDKDDGNDLYYRYITPGASSFSTASAVEVTSEEQKHAGQSSIGGPAGKGVLLGTQAQDDNDYLRYITLHKPITFTNSVSYGSEGTVPAPGTGITWGSQPVRMGFDNVANKIVIAAANTSNKTFMMAGTVTGGTTNTIAFGDGVNPLTNDQAQDAKYGKVWGLRMNPDLGRLMGVGQEDAANPDKFFVFTCSFSGNNVTAINRTERASQSTNGFYTGQWNVEYDTEFNRMMWGSRVSTYNSSDTIGEHFVTVGNQNTNYSASNMVGLAETSASDGGSVKYAPLGSVATTSSLTVGQVLYHSSDGGALTTTSTNNYLVGKAISTTQLLLKPWTGS